MRALAAILLAILFGITASCGSPAPGARAEAAAPAGQGAAALPGSPGVAAANDDLFAFAAGARFVQSPADADFHQMAYSPLNMLDESAITDWRGKAAQPAVFVIELPERAAISRLAFDSAPFLRDGQTLKRVKVEISDTSATAGFATLLETDLKMATREQDFPLATAGEGRWVRLTVESNYGDEYYGLSGFRGYGRQLSQGTAHIENVSGTYRGSSGWGRLHLKQEGSRVVGCYDYREGLIAGGIEGNLLKVEMTEHINAERTETWLGLFALAPGSKEIFGLTRRAADTPNQGYSAYYSGVRESDDIGDCPAIPGWRTASAAQSQLAEQLTTERRARLDGINFAFNSAVIEAASKPLLDQVVGMLKDKADWRITLEGHTDNIGGAAFNARLSTERAAAVKAYLIAGGVDGARLESQGFGFDRPVATNDTQAGRAQNRRVEIVRR